MINFWRPGHLGTHLQALIRRQLSFWLETNALNCQRPHKHRAGRGIKSVEFCKRDARPVWRYILPKICSKTRGGGLTPPWNVWKTNRFRERSFIVNPSSWPSFIEIGEMACVAPAWSSPGHALNFFQRRVNSDQSIILWHIFILFQVFSHISYI